MSSKILDLYEKLRNEGKNPEFEIRVFDGFGKMDVTEENFNTLLNLDIFEKGGKEERSLTFTKFKKRIEIPLGNKNKPGNRTVIEKKRLMAITDNGFRLSLSLEEPAVARNGNNETKFFRYRERISRISSEFPGWRFDFAKVYQVSLQKTTPIKEILKNKLKSPTWQYEVEIEYISSDQKIISNDIDKLIAIITQNIKQSPMLSIGSILNKPTRNPRHLMNQVISLSLDDVHDLYEGYSVTEKADGLRMLLYIDANGVVYEIPSTGLRPSALKYRKKGGRESLLDVEYLEDLNKYLLFDILILEGENVTAESFARRYELLNDNFAKFGKGVTIKKFYFIDNDLGAISKKVYEKKYDYYVDGLIYTPVNASYYNKCTFKWKPAKDLTIDLLIREPADNLVINSDGIYKVVQLFFMISRYQWIKYYKHERKMTELTSKLFGLNSRRLPDYFPFPFIPDGDTKAFYAKIKVSEIDLNNYNDNLGKFSNFKDKKLYIADGVVPMVPILDNMVIEFAYDPKAKNRWIPYRFRKDKTEDYFKGLERGEFVPGPNGWHAAMKNWQLIHEPVTKEIIFGEVPLPDKYYKRTRNVVRQTGELAKFMYKFNNHVKRELYKRYVSPGDRVMEVAGGRGGDIDKALQQGAIQIVLIDNDSHALKEAERRSKEIRKRFNKNVQIDFLRYDLNQNVTANVEQVIKSKMNVVSCQFAFHYFVRDLRSLKNITKLVDHFLLSGGYFMFTGLDGRTVFDLLKKKKEIVFEKNGERIASIDKLYTGNRLKNYGQEIDVYIEKIGLKHKEYLLNFKVVIKHFEKMGYTLTESDFFNFEGFANVNKLSDAEKSYASMNRYAVLRKND